MPLPLRSQLYLFPAYRSWALEIRLLAEEEGKLVKLPKAEKKEG